MSARPGSGLEMIFVEPSSAVNTKSYTGFCARFSSETPTV
jgi:hypothetical protein